MFLNTSPTQPCGSKLQPCRHKKWSISSNLWQSTFWSPTQQHAYLKSKPQLLLKALVPASALSVVEKRCVQKKLGHGCGRIICIKDWPLERDQMKSGTMASRSDRLPRFVSADTEKSGPMEDWCPPVGLPASSIFRWLVSSWYSECTHCWSGHLKEETGTWCWIYWTKCLPLDRNIYDINTYWMVKLIWLLLLSSGL